MWRSPTKLVGLAGLVGASAVANLALGQFRLGFAGQPVAHTDALANFAGALFAHGAGFASSPMGPANGALWLLALLAGVTLAFALWTRRRAAGVELPAAGP